MSSTMPTTLDGGRYQLGQLIGRGGMAEVHVALDTRLGRTVAIKIMRPDLAHDEIFLTRFRREAHSVAQMNNPNIVNIYDSGEEVVTRERRPAGEHFVEHAARGVEVGAHVDAFAARLLGGEVLRGADHAGRRARNGHAAADARAATRGRGAEEAQEERRDRMVDHRRARGARPARRIPRVTRPPPACRRS